MAPPASTGARQQTAASPKLSAPESDLLPGTLFNIVQPGPSAPAVAPAPVAQGESSLNNATLDIMAYLSAITKASSASISISGMFPDPAAVSSSVSASASFSATVVTAPGKMSVPASCMKEVMLSPLGYHLSLSVKEKIWKGDFVDVLSLLPAAKDFIPKTDRKERIDRRRIGVGLYLAPLLIG